MKEFLVRSWVGALLVIVIAGSILFLPLLFEILLIPIACIVLYEALNFYPKQKPTKRVMMIVLSVSILLVVGMGIFQERIHLIFGGISTLYVIISIRELFLKEKKLPSLLVIWFYTLVPFILLMQLMVHLGHSDQEYVVLLVFLIVWFNDTFAYFGGKLFGRKKLWPSISLGKTWEGTVVGVLFGVVVAVLGEKYLNIGFSYVEVAILGGLCAVASVGGDLIESKFKRIAGVKDSGHVLPAHGGLFDRFDGLMLAVPVVFILSILFL